MWVSFFTHACTCTHVHMCVYIYFLFFCFCFFVFLVRHFKVYLTSFTCSYWVKFLWLILFKVRGEFEKMKTMVTFPPSEWELTKHFALVAFEEKQHFQHFQKGATLLLSPPPPDFCILCLKKNNKFFFKGYAFMQVLFCTIIFRWLAFLFGCDLCVACTKCFYVCMCMCVCAFVCECVCMCEWVTIN